MTLNLMQTLQQAGFKGPGLAQAWAHAMKESGGNPNAYNGNYTSGDRSWGLFQINTLGPLQARVKQYGLKSEQDLLDPVVNARVAYTMSKGGTDFGPWSGDPRSRNQNPATVARYKKWLGMFPGAKSGAQKGAIADQAAGAWQAGPAAIVAGPSPQENLKMRQLAAGAIIQQASNVVRGGSMDFSGVTQVIGNARMELAKATMAANRSTLGAVKYDGTLTDPSPGVGSGQMAQAIAIAKQQIGKPYVWGGETPNEGGFDCSGLIDYAFRKAGINIPGGRLTTYSALRTGQSVRGQPMQPGDWLITNGKKHMVMYVGGGQVISAPRRGETVQYQPVSRFIGQVVDVRRFTGPRKAK